jgi:hypothetical protein
VVVLGSHEQQQRQAVAVAVVAVAPLFAHPSLLLPYQRYYGFRFLVVEQFRVRLVRVVGPMSLFDNLSRRQIYCLSREQRMQDRLDQVQGQQAARQVRVALSQ